MCRHHLPGWQEAWQSRDDRGDVAFVAIAMDAQGWQRARPWVDEAGLAFPAAVDREGVLWERLDFDFVPLQILFDEEGREMLRTRGGPDEDLLAKLDHAFAADSGGGRPGSSRIGGQVAREDAAAARELFARGVEALDAGESEQAAELWKQALERDPGNWLIRKQIWALENPEKFYSGAIDGEWQREIMQRLQP